MANRPDLGTLVLRLLDAATEQTKFSGMNELLKIVAEAYGADGAVLWQLSGGPEVSESQRLIAMAQWYAGERKTNWFSVNMTAPTGKALLAEPRKPVLYDAKMIEEAKPLVRRDDPDDPTISVLEELGVQSFLIVPIERQDGKPVASLNLYSHHDRWIPPDWIDDASKVGQAIWRACDQVTQNAGFVLLNEVAKHLRNDDTLPSGRLPALDKVVKEIKQRFGAFECSIYVEEPHDTSRVVLNAFRWPWNPDLQRQSYSRGEGFTGYCYMRAVPMRVPDLRLADNQHKEWLKELYPGAKAQLFPQIWHKARELWGLRDQDRDLPLAWMAAPLFDGKRCIGVVRLCGTEHGPHYFSEKQLEVLQLVADQLGDWVGSRRRVLLLDSAARELKVFLQAERDISIKVQTNWDKLPSRDFRRQIFDDTLAALEKALPNVHSLSIRIIDRGRKHLSYQEGAIRGKAWDEGGREKAAERKSRQFPLDTKSPSMAKRALDENKAVYVDNLPQSVYETNTFEGVRSMIVAPIGVRRSKAYGTVDVRSQRLHNFDAAHVGMVEAIARRLGLYLFLGDQLQELQEARREIAHTLAEQREQFENLQHQLKSHAFLAARRADRVFEKTEGLRAHHEAAMLRSLTVEIVRIVKNLRVFADLAAGRPLRLDKTGLTVRALSEQLDRMITDYSLLVDPDKRLSFQIDRASLGVLVEHIVMVDESLLVQMLGNLLENAAKYSYPRTVVQLRCGITRKDARRETFFYVEVSNRGIAIQPNEARALGERGSRTFRASQDRKKDGTGLGLYLVKEMLAAHNGFLDIIPTAANGITAVRLLLPIGGAQ